MSRVHQEIPRSPSAANISRLPPTYTVRDPSTLSDPHVAIISHLHLDLTADFNAKRLRGHVELTVSILKQGLSEFVLDTSHLEIYKVHLLCSQAKELHFSVDKRHPIFGSALRISLPSNLLEDEEIKLKIEYSTTPKSTAVQWLEPEMTVGKSHPYLFTQCQAIHARSLLPCQDTPMVKHTYSAKISAPEPLRAVMSAHRDPSKKHCFHLSVPIPAYLIALAIGNLAEREIGPRSTLFTEPEIIDAASFEFKEETEKFIATAESLLTPYIWGRYDLLVLPGSFPYGGMENPCLTFVTPTLIAGDRSLVDVVAHEIAHSWTGNLVTNATWESFWLNEGFTMFVERKIIGKLFGEPVRQLSAIVGLKHLQEDVDHFGVDNPLTALCPKLENTDPDDAFSGIPYEKGFNLLYELESLLGGPKVFDEYVKAHVIQFAGKSITVDDWRMFLYTWVEEHLGVDGVAILKTKIDWESWLFKPGFPPKKAKFDTSLADECCNLADAWHRDRNLESDNLVAKFSGANFESFVTLQKIVFLDSLISKQPKFPPKALAAMQTVYKLSESRNAEIRFRWQTLCLNSGQTSIFPHVVQFLTEQGRMKYVRPLYRSLAAASPEGRVLALETFTKSKDFYHPIAAAMISKDLGS